MRRAGTVGLGVVLATLVIGCSGDDGGSSPPDTTTSVATTTTVPAPTAEAMAAAVCAARRVPGRERVADPELNELSGLVSLDSGLWAHNDSGDEARVFRLDEAGATQAVVHLEGIDAFDWEDLSGAGPSAGELFVGDIGDNEAIRNEVTVLRFAVPDPAPVGEVTIPADEIQTITLRYPDGPRDAETLLVDPVTRDIVIVDKRFGGASEVYQATEADWADGDAELERIGIVEVGRHPARTPPRPVTSGLRRPGGGPAHLRRRARVPPWTKTSPWPRPWSTTSPATPRPGSRSRARPSPSPTRAT